MKASLTRGRAVLLVGLLGIVLVGTSLPTWARGEGRGTDGPVPIVLAGTDAAPAVPSAGLVIIVAALVIGLSGRATRIAALAGAGLAALLAGWSGIAFLGDPEPPLVSAAGEATRVRDLVGAVSVTAWPVVTVVAAAVVALVVLVLPWQFGRWAAVGRRYQRGPADSADTADTAGQAGPSGQAGPADDGSAARRVRAMDDWDAIGRGEDPSADPDR
ncbi:Trp biosynthesis-associated membrane protein [Pseudactinotalea sp. HY158]|uniref:Trp biosynthesis-associated membrane protein n=1 Tax=Pseudactinotalea sp. HY158 TaxID=2654547 RepID=UPI00129C4897|nr:Trp biosynthesis-associated membrane protein [Pseudactinotalea sp. HY158]QGH69180.1 hypothetical protein GCE65_06395 [Pseudactinotalea sp. HY158]